MRGFVFLCSILPYGAAFRPALKSTVSMGAVGKGSKVTIIGPGELSLKICAAKAACAYGYEPFVVVESDTTKTNARALAYGREYATSTQGGKDRSGKAAFVVTPEEIGSALQSSQGLIVLTGADKALPDNFVSSVFNNAKGLKRVALHSAEGGSSGELAKTEAEIREAAGAANIEWSIARGGTLRGGGPGRFESPNDVFGMDKFYYDSNGEIDSYQKDAYADKWLLGATLLKGDPIKLNPISKFACRSSINPRPGLTSRIALGGALVQCLKQEVAAGADFTVSMGESEDCPTEAEWSEVFGKVCGEGAETATTAVNGVAPVGKVDVRKAAAMGQELDGKDKDRLVNKKYDLGATSLAEETERKQIIGHLIPLAIGLGSIAVVQPH